MSIVPLEVALAGIVVIVNCCSSEERDQVPVPVAGTPDKVSVTASVLSVLNCHTEPFNITPDACTFGSDDVKVLSAHVFCVSNWVLETAGSVLPHDESTIEEVIIRSNGR